MKIAVFTSCALNYLPKALVLAESLKRFHPDAPITLCLNDLPTLDRTSGIECFDSVWTPHDLGYDNSWIFKHNVMELCTAVKGRALKRLMELNDADLYLFLDPDVLILDSLDEIGRLMDGASVGLVPHITVPEATEIGVEMTELSIVAHGTYNLGHLIVRNDENGNSFANWWAARLDQFCYDDKPNGLFTDQRWADLAPALFDGVRVLRHPGLDVASWNLSGRTITFADSGNKDKFEVNGSKLITYHYSGSGAKGSHRTLRARFAPTNPATAELERRYEAAIEARGQSRMTNIVPAYDIFESGATIPDAARLLYRAHEDLQETFQDPFRTNSADGGYHGWLESNRPTLLSPSGISSANLNRAYNDLFDESYYVRSYPTVADRIESGECSSAIDHYEKNGIDAPIQS